METDSTKTCPSGKVRFGTKGEIKTYIRFWSMRNGGKRYRYHFCAECGGWHLTTHTVQGDYMLKKHAKHYSRLEKKRTDNAIYDLYGIAI